MATWSSTSDSTAWCRRAVPDADHRLRASSGRSSRCHFVCVGAAPPFSRPVRGPSFMSLLRAASSSRITLVPIVLSILEKYTAARCDLEVYDDIAALHQRPGQCDYAA